MDKTEALKSIRQLAATALETDNPELLRKHLEMIQTIVAKALPRRARS